MTMPVCNTKFREVTKGGAVFIRLFGENHISMSRVLQVTGMSEKKFCKKLAVLQAEPPAALTEKRIRGAMPLFAEVVQRKKLKQD